MPAEPRVILRRNRSGVVLIVIWSVAPHAPAVAQSAADTAAGKEIFHGLCSRCDGIDGSGDEGPSGRLDNPDG